MNKKLLRFGFIVMTIAGMFFINSCSQPSQKEESAEMTEEPEQEEEKAPVASPRMQAEGEISGVTIKLDYGSPAVKGREIFGGLEAYDKVWRAGANETTNVEFASDVIINETTVPAGKYGVFMIPKKEGDWTVILNSTISWGASDYDEENDVARIEVTPTWAEDVQERLQFEVGAESINFAWDKARLVIPVTKAE